MIVHDAAATFVALITAAFAWVQVLAGVAAIVLCAVPLCIAPGVKAARRRLRRPLWARGRLRARIFARTRVRRPHRRTEPLPHWARTEPHRYEEAA